MPRTGSGRNVSPDVLDAVALAPGLDDRGAHPHNLARPASGRRRPARPQRVCVEMRQAQDAPSGVLAHIIGRQLDVPA
ncbi:hypothetical protein [Embleya hyalina]|uniref:Uncharacterized protein n=1 Tax=Embleya hyalina TaxID=516124 RepID=A0A401Z5S0_9ACTN|nr:hypothetical protein [Embleya hyalina]GCE02210.1 hypothetical protein EHYA_09987 [Embleya hyalina]